MAFERQKAELHRAARVGHVGLQQRINGYIEVARQDFDALRERWDALAKPTRAERPDTDYRDMLTSFSRCRSQPRTRRRRRRPAPKKRIDKAPQALKTAMRSVSPRPRPART